VRSRKFLPAVAIFAAAGLVSGCSSSAKKGVQPPCKPARPPAYPSTGAALTDPDAGGVWCVSVGQTLAVTLHVPPGDTGPPWQPVASADSSVLQPAAKGAGTVPRRATVTFFSVRKAGIVAISAKRGTVTLWNATVVARAK